MKNKSWMKFLLFLWCVTFLVLMLAMSVHAQEDVSAIDSENKRYYGIAAGVAMGLCGIGTALGMGNASAAAVGAITERPEIFGKSMIFIVMLEAIAIYGLVTAVLLIGLAGA